MALSGNKEKRKNQLANLKPCKPGETHNPSGRPKKLPITEALQEFFKDPANVQAYIDAAAKHARNGSSAHFKEINDRVEGKPKETLEVSGNIDLRTELAEARKRAGID